MLSFALYLATLAPTVLPGDAGEFQFVAPLAGIAHPTGYPLYLLLGWLWTHIVPFGSAAFRMNLFSAAAAGAAVGVLYLAAQRFLDLAGFIFTPQRNRAIALLAAGFFAISATFWSQAVIAEVYALHALLVILWFYLVLRWLDAGSSPGRLAPAAIVLGLALAHHRTTILLVPGVVLAVWMAGRRRTAAIGRQRVLALAGMALLPLLLYLYVPARAPASPYLSVPLQPAAPLQLYEPGIRSFADHVLGRSFEGSLDPSLLGLDRLRMAFDLLLRQFALPGVVLGVLGVAWLAIRRRWVLLALTALPYLMLVAFNLIYAIGDIHVMYIPTYMIWALWMAAGVAWMAQLAGRLLLSRRPPARNGNTFRRSDSVGAWAIIAATLFAPALLFTANVGLLDQSDNMAAWQTWQTILAQPLPEGAVLVSNDRDEIMPLWYFQQVDRQRPDLIGLFPLIVDDGGWDDVGEVIDQALTSGRPVFLIKSMPGVEIKYMLGPAPAGMVQVMGPAAAPESPRPAGVVLGDAVRLVSYKHTPYSPAPGGEMAVTLTWEVLKPLPQDYSTFVQILDRAGNRVAGSDQRPGGEYYPSHLWKPGELIQDTHRFTVPADLAAGTYQFYVGMYVYPSMERLGDAKLGFVGVKTRIETQAHVPPHVTDYVFGDKIRLIGYELRKEGQSLLLTLEWQALREMELDYTTFVHLLDNAGEFVSQADSQPLGGTYPTSIWDRGEVIMDAYRLPIDLETPAGRYHLAMGLYRLETMERLPAFDAAGRSLGDEIELQIVEWP